MKQLFILWACFRFASCRPRLSRVVWSFKLVPFELHDGLWNEFVYVGLNFLILVKCGIVQCDVVIIEIYFIWCFMSDLFIATHFYLCTFFYLLVLISQNCYHIIIPFLLLVTADISLFQLLLLLFIYTTFICIWMRQAILSESSLCQNNLWKFLYFFLGNFD